MACGDDLRLPRWAQCNLKGGSRVGVGEEIGQQKLGLERWKKGTLNQEFRKPLEIPLARERILPRASRRKIALLTHFRLLDSRSVRE